MRSDGGFTLAELLVSTAIMLTVTGAVFQLLNPAQGAFRAQPEASDLQQRLRVSVDSLAKDLIMAGAGAYAGASAGPLVRHVAPVLPYRVGDADSDSAAGVFFRRDTISLLYVPAAAAQTTLRDSMPTTTSELKVERQDGFTKGMRVALFDADGSWDPITIARVQDEAIGYGGELSAAYAKGTAVAQIAMRTYYLETDVDKKAYQLMRYDGARTDLPIVDNVVRLGFEYFGDPQPPVLLPGTSLSDILGPWTTYGPRPPALGVTGPFGWPAGENCAFRVESAWHVPRLAALGEPGGQIELGQAMLTDGPWCPNATAPERFDADLLRVRRIRVQLRVQVAAESLRGQGALFVRPGTSGGGERYVPDQEIRFDITPRNLSLGR